MGNWKNGAQVAVMICFDLDAETLWLSRDPANKDRPGTLSHGVFGARAAVFDLLKMLAQVQVPSTFFVPGWTAEQHPAAIEAILEGGHEIGHHGYLHEWVGAGDPEREEEVLRMGLASLKRVGGVTPVGYRSPAWEINPGTLNLLEKYRFRYSSNMMADYLPYWLEVEGKKSSIVELPVQWILDDAPNFLFSVRPPYRNIVPNRDVLEGWKEEFLGIYREGGLYDLTLHPQLSGRPGRVDMLRDLINYIHKFPHVWFATGAQIADYWRENCDLFQRQ